MNTQLQNFYREKIINILVLHDRLETEKTANELIKLFTATQPTPEGISPEDNLSIIQKGIEFARTLYTDSESYKSGAAFGYSCGYQAASLQPSAKEEGKEIPEQVMKYVEDSFLETASIYGKVKRISQYAGSIFIIFEDDACYRLNWQAYNQNTVTLD